MWKRIEGGYYTRTYENGLKVVATQLCPEFGYAKVTVLWDGIDLLRADDRYPAYVGLPATAGRTAVTLDQFKKLLEITKAITEDSLWSWLEE